MNRRLRLLVGFLFALTLSTVSFAYTPEVTTRAPKRTAKLTESSRVRKRLARTRRRRATLRNASLSRASLTKTRRRAHRYVERFTASSYADDITEGDNFAGEDAVVRQAAIDALGNMNGTVVAIDPSNGRILAMVNQKLALSSGAEPCSTIKVSVA